MSKTNPKVSVIVPVYNAEKYLNKCVDSILHQTFTDFELILVNDGSTDRSPIICDAYSSEDLRVKVTHKSNGGVSSARNIGLGNAKGEYICFIDSDDRVSEFYIENLINKEADLCVSGFIKENNNEIQIHSSEEIFSTNFRKDQSLILPLFYRELLYGPWQKLFKKSIIERINLKFDERLSLGEDTVYVLTYLSEITSIYVSPHTDYHYEDVNIESLTRIRHHSDNTRLFALKMYSLHNDFIKKNEIENTIFKGYVDNKFLTYLFMGVYTLYYENIPHKERYIFLHKVKNDLNETNINLKNKQISYKNKCVFKLFDKLEISFLDSLLWIIFKLYKKCMAF